VVMVEKVVVMNCHVQQKVKVGKTVCDEASVVPWEVHSRDKVHSNWYVFLCSRHGLGPRQCHCHWSARSICLVHLQAIVLRMNTSSSVTR